MNARCVEIEAVEALLELLHWFAEARSRRRFQLFEARHRREIVLAQLLVELLRDRQKNLLRRPRLVYRVRGGRRIASLREEHVDTLADFAYGGFEFVERDRFAFAQPRFERRGDLRHAARPER